MSGMALAYVGTLGGVDWTNITGTFDAAGNVQTMPYGTTITAQISNLSSGQISVNVNGAGEVVYPGPFPVSAGDTVQWSAQTKGTYSATVTVKGTGGFVIDTFTVSLT